ncbi:cation efflux family-domain-containing protein [Paraphoma chrysanthemicola]|uniref:Zinc transporter n=1 Tax=Paraphoma chrysanthemicola TaxID=798071 RepID=A0A8K0QY33_9PLEO|nr:cation efflux family-domain-containing protein [Paraphoma chrysanthemicola]
MASTYALPIAPTSHAHSHERSQSQYSTYSNGSTSNSSPLRGPGHRSHRSDMSGSGQLHGAVRSPYAEYNGHAHDHEHGHGHSHSNSNDSTWTLKPYANGRGKGRPRGDSDLGRSPPRKNAAAARYGFSPVSPIQETAPAVSLPSSSWLELPEALTALLIPLPYLFASLAYPKALQRPSPLPSTLSEAVAGSAPQKDTLEIASHSQLLHALVLSSATLTLVGVIAKITSSLQPLDRRKSEKAPGTFDISKAPKRMAHNVLSVLLPFYAAMQLGGPKVALVLLTAVAAGLGALGRKPGKHTPWDDLRRTLRTRYATCSALSLSVIADILGSHTSAAAVLGWLAILTSVLLVPPPLPTAGWSLIMGSQGQTSYVTQSDGRASLPKPSSPLVNSFENTLLTIASGLSLAVVAILYSLFSSSVPSLSHHTIGFSTLSVASAAALVYFSLPSALRSQKNIGLALGGFGIVAFHLWEHLSTFGFDYFIFPFACAGIVGAVMFDTRSPAVASHSHKHGHSHSGHDHAHDHAHDHHLHGNHSRLSAFLIARATPGSIVHSVLIEKDSRRIAYFGVLNLSFMLVQFFYGFVSGSLGLLTDSIHMLFDCAGLAVGLAAAVMSKWRPNVRFPYGYGKVDTLSGFANGVFLLLVSVEIIFDAFERLWEGHELQRLNELLVVSILGFLVNIVGLTAFGHAHHGHGHDHGHEGHDHGHGHSHDNENMQGIFLHILADALGSVAVIISTLLTKYYGWSGWDPIASCIIAILIFLSAIPLVKSSGARLMLSLPNDLEYGIRNTLGELGTLRGVVGYTVPKFWLEDEGAAHAEAHAKEEDHDCGHKHDHTDHDHSDHKHAHAHDHSHSHSHDHSHAHSHSHSPSHDHDHDHDHDHAHPPQKQRVLGVIHIIASRAADLEDVRERSVQFLKDRGMEVVVHVEKEGEGRCWCGGGLKTN